MARTDAIVLGAGIVGVCVALHLVKRGASVALLDRGDPGRGTSYGNAGIIEGNTLFPATFPSRLGALLRIALKQAPEANDHASFLPQVAPWLLAFRRNSAPERLVATMQAMRPLFSRAVAEHEALMAESDAERYLRRTGWLKLYRSDGGFAATGRERAIAADLGLPVRALDADAARALEPSLAPVFRHAVFWEDAASVSNPLAVTRAYVRRFEALGGVAVTGDARSLRRTGTRWRIETDQGAIDTDAAVITLGPWAPDVLSPIGIRLPLGIKSRLPPPFRRARQCELGATEFSMPTSAIASPRWSRASASPPARNSPRAMPRRRRCNSIACCRRPATCFRSARRSRTSHGLARGRALRIRARCSAALPASRTSGLPTAMAIRG